MPTTWYTSDLHLSHELAVKAREDQPAFRPEFEGSIEKMNQTIIERWNAVVDPDDRVFVLGDVALGTIADSLPLVRQLNGYKMLVPGNHDRCWSGNVKSSKPEKRQKEATKVLQWRNKYVDAGFYLILPGSLHDIPLGAGDIQVDLCHFPYYGDHSSEDRYPEWRPVDQGRWLLHGHLHNSLGAVRDRMIDVGVDAWDYTPVSAKTLAAIITEQEASNG